MGVIKLSPEQIETWVARHFEYRRRKDGQELITRNPFLGDDKFKFNISTILKETRQGHLGYWVHDWRPHAQQYNMSFIRFVQLYKDLSFKEALKDICGDKIDLKSILSSAKPKLQEEPQYEVELTLPAGSKFITEKSKLQQIIVNYLKSRGINYTTAQSLQLHYTGPSIVFPYLEYDTIVYWQSRSVASKEFEFPDERFVGVSKSQFLYGFDNTEPYQPIFLVEAIFCALSLGPGALATGGADLSEFQRRKIRAINPSKVILAPDNDEAGRASLYRNFKLLNPYADIYYVLPPKKFKGKQVKDWNDIVKMCKNKNKGRQLVRLYAESNAKPLNLPKAIQFRIDKPD